MEKSTIKNLQATMKHNGFYDGEVDGVWGNMSQAAFYATVEAANHCQAHSGSDEVNDKPLSEPLVAQGEFKLSDASLKKLEGVHADLQKVVKLAITKTSVDFMVGEGLRTITRQKQLFAEGATKTMNSRHLTGHAIDLFALDEGNKVTWEWKPYYFEINRAMTEAAKELGIAIEWGGDWKWKDGPHYQLPWKGYPAK